MRTAALILPALAIAAAAQIHAAGDAQAPAPRRAWVRRIEFEGLQRYRPEQVIPSSGLRIGEPVDIAAVAGAALRLRQTGLFRSVGDRYEIINDQIDVTFIVEEGTVGLPVEFDNFVWFTDAELREAVAREVPLFDGTAPELGTLIDDVGGALEKLLQQKGIKGRVERLRVFVETGGRDAYVMAVKEAPLRICSLSFPGAGAIAETTLQETASPLVGVAYSRSHLTSYAELTLRPLYARRGYLKASFGEPVPVPDTAAPCGGVRVSVPVKEGRIFRVGPVEWSAGSVLSRRELEERLSIRPGDVADGVRLQTGLNSIRQALAERGHLGAKTQVRTEADDGTGLAVWRIEVTEGPLYRMGALVLAGFPDKVATRIRALWKVPEGAPWDGAALKPFLDQVAMLSARGAGGRSCRSSVKADHDRLTVNVTLTLL